MVRKNKNLNKIINFLIKKELRNNLMGSKMNQIHKTREKVGKRDNKLAVIILSVFEELD